MKSSCWSCHCTFILRINRLVTLSIFWFNRTLNVLRKWRLAQAINQLFEIFMRTVVQETKRSSTRSSVIYNLGYQFIVWTEIQLISNTNLTSWIYYGVPKQTLVVQFTQQENLDHGSGLFFITIHTRRKNLRVVVHHYIAFAKII